MGGVKRRTKMQATKLEDLVRARWFRLGRPLAFILRVSRDGKHADYCVRYDAPAAGTGLQSLSVFRHQGERVTEIEL